MLTSTVRGAGSEGLPARHVVAEINKLTKHKPSSLPGDIRGRKVLVLKDEDLKSSSGLDRLQFEFLDDKVTEIYVHYPRVPFADQVEFLNSVSNSMHLPTKAWVLKHHDLIEYKYEMSCNGFTATLQHNGSWDASIALTDSSAEAEVKRRTEEQMTREKKVFKP
jgi:hypothetical protein